MNPSLTEFRDKYRELLLNFLWRQWSALGVAGHSRSDDPWIIDPEALLLFTCTLGRHEPRLFDEVIDWLQANGPFINILRLKRILRTEKFAGEPRPRGSGGSDEQGSGSPEMEETGRVRGTGWLDSKDYSSRKTGRPCRSWAIPIRTLPAMGSNAARCACAATRSRSVPPSERISCCNCARSSVSTSGAKSCCTCSPTKPRTHRRLRATPTTFARAVQNTLVEMSRSGIVQLRSSGREKHYWLKTEHWAALLNRDEPFPKWITWPPLFSALERIWLKLNDPKLVTLDPLLQSSEVRQLMIEVRPSIERAGFDRALSDDRQYLGEEYLPVFLSDIARILG